MVEIEEAGKCNLCIECHKYAEECGLIKAVEIGENDSKFNFTVESTGALPPVEIVKKGLAILKAKISKFSDDLLESTAGNAANMGF